MQKTILLTGGTGFLGSALLHRFVQDGYSVVLLKRSFSSVQRIKAVLPDIRPYDIDRVQLAQIFTENKIDMIIHCATNYGRRFVPPSEIIQANLMLPLHLLQLADTHQVGTFINSDTILDKGVNYYSLSKSQFVDWLRLFSQSILCANVTLEHFYGPFDDRSKFVTNILMQLLEQVEAIDLTLGTQRRDFIYIDDVVDAFCRVMEFCDHGGAGFFHFEVGTTQTISVRDFVELARELTGNIVTRLNFGALPFRANEVMESRVDVSALTRLGWTAKTDLRMGLQKTIQIEKGKIEL
ncbi:NAD(P)-dependent oxidoreductase [bacterium]|nr:MAG: NAD(P)-dependent oxidoreductase [bacterium]